MFNARNEDDFADDEEFESETPEAGNEHHPADINIHNNMDQRMLINNAMLFDRKIGNEGHDAGAYRSKSQNMTKPIDKDVHPKSQVSSPIDGSSSTVRAWTTIPSTLQAETGIQNITLSQTKSLRNHNSTNKKSRRAVTKTYSKLNLKSGKWVPPQGDPHDYDKENSSTWINQDPDALAISKVVRLDLFIKFEFIFLL